MKFRSDPRQIKGSLAPLMTPFTADGSVDHDSLANMVNWQLANGTNGISLGGSTGEPSSQSISERIAAMKTVNDAIGDRVPFMPGTGSAKLDETLEVTAAAQAMGVDAALIITPYYARPTQEALYQWYATVAREFPDLPLVAYNVPIRTSVELAPETFARLYRDFDNIVGIKETTKDFEHFSYVFHKCGKDLLMWSGIELLCLPLLALGGIGFISALANIAPQAVSDMFWAYEEGNQERAREIHYGVHPLVDLLFVETNPSPCKTALAMKGMMGEEVRLPLVPSSTATRELIRKTLTEADLL
jgi:4-hydroxy-tetrahydrodipicolinate synthase